MPLPSGLVKYLLGSFCALEDLPRDFACFGEVVNIDKIVKKADFSLCFLGFFNRIFFTFFFSKIDN